MCKQHGPRRTPAAPHEVRVPTGVTQTHARTWSSLPSSDATDSLEAVAVALLEKRLYTSAARAGSSVTITGRQFDSSLPTCVCSTYVHTREG